MTAICKNKKWHRIVTAMLLFVIFLTPVFVATAATEPKLPLSCGIWGDSNIVDCFAVGVYYFITVPSSALVAVSGTLFDTMLQVTLSKEILGNPAIATSWKVVRDIFNIVFIFILLIISFGFILRTGYGQKQLLVNVIIAALLVNFSLVAARVVIDASNIIALQFHKSITVTNATSIETGTNKVLNKLSSVEHKPISIYFAGSFNPQKIYAETFTDFVKKDIKAAAAASVVFLSMAVVNVITAYAFLVASILLIARTVILIFLMISAPVAFVAWILPASRDIAMRWWHELLNQAFVAPVFLFFIYIIFSLIETGKILSFFE